MHFCTLILKYMRLPWQTLCSQSRGLRFDPWLGNEDPACRPPWPKRENSSPMSLENTKQFVELTVFKVPVVL